MQQLHTYMCYISIYNAQSLPAAAITPENSFPYTFTMQSIPSCSVRADSFTTMSDSFMMETVSSSGQNTKKNHSGAKERLRLLVTNM